MTTEATNLKNEQNADDSGRWGIEASTKPGTPRAIIQRADSDRMVIGPGLYSEIYEELGPLTIRTSKY